MKRLIAFLLSFIMIFTPVLFTASAKTDNIPEIDDIVSSFKSDISSMKSSVKAIKKFARGLRTGITPYLLDVVITADNVETALSLTSRLFVRVMDEINKPKEPAKPVKPADPAEPTEPTDPIDPVDPVEPPKPARDMAISEMRNILSRYVFVRVDDIDKATLEALETSEISYSKFTDSDGTVYIRVDIEENPGIFNIAVFRKLVEELYKKQNAELLKNGNGETDYAMSYRHIAGELALHAIVYAATNEVIEVTGTKNETVLKLYDSASKADLNIDEARLPTEVLSILGTLLMDFFKLSVLKLFV